jgi:hypothetical protein
VEAEHLKLSKVKKVELFDFMKEARNKEEYRRGQKLEGLPYRTIARNPDVNYRNVYNWIKEYKEYGLDGIRSKRKNAGRIPKISSDKNKERVKEIITKSPRTLQLLFQEMLFLLAMLLRRLFLATINSSWLRYLYSYESDKDNSDLCLTPIYEQFYTGDETAVIRGKE